MKYILLSTFLLTFSLLSQNHCNASGEDIMPACGNGGTRIIHGQAPIWPHEAIDAVPAAIRNNGIPLNEGIFVPTPSHTTPIDQAHIASVSTSATYIPIPEHGYIFSITSSTSPSHTTPIDQAHTASVSTSATYIPVPENAHIPSASTSASYTTPLDPADPVMF